MELLSQVLSWPADLVPVATTTHKGAIYLRTGPGSTGPEAKGRHKEAVPIVPSSSFCLLRLSFLRSRRVTYPPPPCCSKNTVLEQRPKNQSVPPLLFPINKSPSVGCPPPQMCVSCTCSYTVLLFYGKAQETHGEALLPCVSIHLGLLLVILRKMESPHHQGRQGPPAISTRAQRFHEARHTFQGALLGTISASLLPGADRLLSPQPEQK